jgi:hypothetical protein
VNGLASFINEEKAQMAKGKIEFCQKPRLTEEEYQYQVCGTVRGYLYDQRNAFQQVETPASKVVIEFLDIALNNLKGRPEMFIQSFRPHARRCADDFKAR